jgi:hypothetical protein
VDDDNELSEGQKIMLADGCPRAFLMTAEQRRKIWEERPPKYMSTRDFLGEKQMVENESGEEEVVTKKEVSDIDRSIFTEMITEFNRTVEEAKAVGLPNVPKKVLEPSLKSPKDVEKLRKKLAALRSSITAFQKGQAEADAQDVKETTNVRKSNTKAKTKAKVVTKAAPKKTEPRRYTPGSPCPVDKLQELLLGTRDTSKKAKALDYLIKNARKPVSDKKLCAATYDGDSDNLGPLKGGVVGGLNAKLKDGKFPWEIKYEDNTYVLQSIKR